MAALELKDPRANKKQNEYGKRVVSPTSGRTIVLPAPSNDRSFGEVATDTAAGLGTGVNALIQSGAQAVGALTGNIDNAVAKRAGKNIDFWKGLESPGQKEDIRRRKIDIDNAEGVLGKAGAAFMGTMTRPALIQNFATEQLPMLVGTGAGGLAARGAANIALKGKAAISAAKKAEAAATAAKVGTAGAVGTGSALHGGSVAGETYSRLLAQPEGRLESTDAYQQQLAQGLDPTQAREATALGLSREAGLKAGATGLATNLLPGGRVLERALTGQAGHVKGKLAGVVRGALGESAGEAIEEGSGQYFGNEAVQQVDPAQSLSEGVGEAAGMGALSGIFGGVAGLTSSAAPPAPRPGPVSGALNAAPQLPAPADFAVDSRGNAAPPAPFTNEPYTGNITESAPPASPPPPAPPAPQAGPGGRPIPPTDFPDAPSGTPPGDTGPDTSGAGGTPQPEQYAQDDGTPFATVEQALQTKNERQLPVEFNPVAVENGFVLERPATPTTNPPESENDERREEGSQSAETTGGVGADASQAASADGAEPGQRGGGDAQSPTERTGSDGSAAQSEPDSSGQVDEPGKAPEKPLRTPSGLLDVAAGTRLELPDGRMTTPFPDVNLESAEEVAASGRRSDRWVLFNARQKARANPDDERSSAFADARNPSAPIEPEEVARAEAYLWGEPAADGLDSQVTRDDEVDDGTGRGRGALGVLGAVPGASALDENGSATDRGQDRELADERTQDEPAATQESGTGELRPERIAGASDSALDDGGDLLPETTGQETGLNQPKKLTPQQRQAERRKIDSSRDDLLTAISKLGGLNTELENDFAGRLSHIKTPVGMPNLESKNGKGRSLDDLATALMEEGYLLPSQVGNGSDQAALANLIEQAAAGKKILSLNAAEGEFFADDNPLDLSSPEDFITAYPEFEQSYLEEESREQLPAEFYAPEIDPPARALTELTADLEKLGVPSANIQSTIEAMAQAGDSTETIMSELFQLAEDRREQQATEQAGTEGTGASAQQDGFLESYSESDLSEQAATVRAQAAADTRQELSDQASTEPFVLSGSDREADQAAAQGQQDLLAPAENAGANTTPVEGVLQPGSDQGTVGDKTGKPSAVTQMRGYAENASEDVYHGETVGNLTTGQATQTATGRTTTVFPMQNYSTRGKARNSEKRIDKWLMQNAVDEATERGDTTNAAVFNQSLTGTITPSDRDSAAEYLFGGSGKPAAEAERATLDASETEGVARDRQAPPTVEQLVEAGREPTPGESRADAKPKIQANIKNNQWLLDNYRSSAGPDAEHVGELVRGAGFYDMTEDVQKAIINSVTVSEVGDINKNTTVFREAFNKNMDRFREGSAKSLSREYRDAAKLPTNRSKYDPERAKPATSQPFEFGPHKGKRIEQIAQEDPDYLVELVGDMSIIGEQSVEFQDYFDDWVVNNSPTREVLIKAQWERGSLSWDIEQQFDSIKNDDDLMRIVLRHSGVGPSESLIQDQMEEANEAMEILKALQSKPAAEAKVDKAEAKPAPEAEARPADYGANNTLFTKSAADAARERLRAKLGRLSAGFDPETLQDAVILAGYHVESGVRSFADFTKAMVEDIGEGIRPFLRGTYENLRYYPGLDTEGFSTAAEIDAAEKNNVDLPGNDNDAVQGESAQDNEGTTESPDVPADSGTDGGRNDGANSSGSTGTGTQNLEQRPDSEDATSQSDPVGTDGSGDQSTRGNDLETGRADNYRISESDELGKGGAKTKARQNIAAIKIVKRLAEDNRPATREEQAQLVKYTGWGSSELANGIFPNKKQPKADWKALHDEVKSLLSDEQWKEASRSTQYAHYTSESVVRGIYEGLEKLGHKGGLTLEPGLGVGHFVGMMPKDMAANTHYTGIEYDGITAAIAEALYPQSNIKHADFTRFEVPENRYDLVIGNPPFAKTKIRSDKKYRKHGFNLHEYFFAKSIDSAREGGLLVFVTSRYLMDRSDAKARDYLAERADLLGAVRLPQTAFKANAGTEVVTDVLFFQKRKEGAEPAGQPWTSMVEISTTDGPANVNQYFQANPAQVLGTHALQGSMYGPNEYTVLANETAIEDDFRAALEVLPSDVVVEQGMSVEDRIDATAASDFAAENRKTQSIYLNDGVLMQVEGGIGVPMPIRGGAVKTGLFKTQAALIEKLVPIKETAIAMLDAQLNGRDYARLQTQLNTQYDAFVAKHGPINKVEFRYRKNKDGGKDESEVNPNIPRRIYEDPDAPILITLDTHDPITGNVKKGAILTERVLSRTKHADIKTPSDALAATLNRFGKIDVPFMAEKLSLSEQDVIESLGDLVYQNPISDQYETQDEYLSGRVREKLAEAKVAAESNAAFDRNVQALQKVQPTDIPPSGIKVRFGASWLPTEVVDLFTEEVLGGAIKSNYQKVNGLWTFMTSAERVANEGLQAPYITERADFLTILDAALNQRNIKITDPVMVDGSVKYEINKEQTELARSKVYALRTAFDRWIFSDPDRATELSNTYNVLFNDIVPRKFNGDHLTLPGMSTRYELRGHQKRVVWRQIQSGNTYMAHSVGSGKTLASIAGAMEQKRLGLIKKPMFAVPNHMLKQFSKEFLEAYPAAKILVADEESFSRDKRTKFVARSATEDWDAVIITHSAFGLMKAPAQTEQFLIEKELEAYREALLAVDEEDRVSRKRMENQIENLEQGLSEVQTRNADDGISFEQTGVDMLYVDEAHEFRKLSYATSQGTVKGIDPKGSQMAWDLYVKTRHLKEQNPKRFYVPMSGTPITNTMAELFTIQRFMQEDYLEEKGLHNFDSWSMQYAETKAITEQTAAGGYKVVTRLAKFVNLPELIKSFRDVADVIRPADLAGSVKVPQIKGGAMEIIAVPPTSAMRQYQQQLADRIDDIENRTGRPQPGDDIMLTVIGDGRHAAIDDRYINPARPRHEGSKLGVMINNAFQTWQEGNDTVYHDSETGEPEPIRGSTQMIFADLGISNNRGFSAYDEIKQSLIDKGVPPDQIAFMRDYKKGAAKLKLFSDMNSGRKRILIGSSQNMGTGVNAQQRLIELHHLDAPWIPAFMEQRMGRIVRQGNKNKTVSVRGYATKGTYDSTMFTMLETKQRFIDQMWSDNFTTREAEDVDGDADQYAIAKAISSGDERLITKIGLDNDVARLERLKAAHEDQQVSQANKRNSANAAIRWADEQIKKLSALLPKVIPTHGDNFKALIDGREYVERKEAAAALIQRLRKLDDVADRNASDHEIGTLGGFPMMAYVSRRVTGRDGSPGNRTDVVEVAMDIPNVGSIGAGIEQSPLGLLTKLENQVQSIDRQIAEMEQTKTEAGVHVATADAIVGQPFDRADELREKTEELRALEADILGTPDNVRSNDERPARESSLGSRTRKATRTQKRRGSAKLSREKDKATKPVHSTVVTETARRVSENWEDGPTVTVVSTGTQLPRDILNDAKAQGAPASEIKAVYKKGVVYLVADKHTSARDVEESIFHEVYGHFGVARLFGAKVEKGMADLHKALGGDAGIRAMAEKYGVDLSDYEQGTAAWSDDTRNALLANELLAHIAQSETGRLRQKAKFLIQAIRQWLMNHGFTRLAKVGTTDADMLITGLLKAAQEAVNGAKEFQASPDSAMFMVAFHGTPHDVDKFSTGKIGTGEGAQAYGYGLYFASNKSVAKYYKDALATTTRKHNTFDGVKITAKRLETLRKTDKELDEYFRLFGSGTMPDGITDLTPYWDRQEEKLNEDVARWAGRVKEMIDNPPFRSTYPVEEYQQRHELSQKKLAALKKIRARTQHVPEKKNGNLYEVDLKPAEDEYLLWDAPFDEQSDHVKAALKAAGIGANDESWIVVDDKGNIEKRFRTKPEALKHVEALKQFSFLGTTTPDVKFSVERSDKYFEADGRFITTSLYEEIQYGNWDKWAEYAGVEAEDKKARIEEDKGNTDGYPFTAYSKSGDLIDSYKSKKDAEEAIEIYDAKGAYGDTKNAHQLVSAVLKKAGIRGNKYLDGSSRRKGEGNYNYVIFDDADVEITAKLRRMDASRQQAEKQAKKANVSIKRWLKRNLTKEGLTNETTHDRGIEMDGMKNVGEFEVSAIVRDLTDAMTKAYGQRFYNSIPKETLEKVHEYLVATDDEREAIDRDDPLPRRVREVARAMRSYLDRQSAEMINTISEIIEFQLEDMPQDVRDAIEDNQAHQDRTPQEQGFAKKRIPAAYYKNVQLRKTIQANMGVYLNRSYQAFDDEKWKETVMENTDLMDRAKAFIAEANPDLAPGELTGAVAAILQSAADKGSFLSFLSKGTQQGGKDISITKKRKKIPAVIRELLGEYKDPKLNFARSSANMQWLIANHHFLANVRRDGLGVFLFKTPVDNADGLFDKKVAPKDSDTMNPLNGLYSTVDFEQGLRDATNQFEGSDLMRNLIGLNSLVKYGKTLLSPTTQFRNFQSAAMFTIMNGHFDWTHMATAGKATWADLFTKDEAWRSYLNELVGLGVIHNNPYAGELRDAIKDFTQMDAYAKGPKQNMKRFFGVVQSLYSAGDDFWKIIGYNNELNQFLKAGMPEAEAKQKAAQRIRDGYPTYTQVPRGIKLVRRWPLIGTFVSFPYESMRTAYNQIGFIREDMAAGRTQMASARILGMALASASAYAISKVSMMMMGMDDDDDEAVLSVMPDWSRNSELVYLGYDENGLPRYLDASYLDPYTYLKKPLTALVNGNNQGIDKKLADALRELAAPFIGVDIAAGALMEIVMNKKFGGGEVFNEADEVSRQAASILEHAWRSVRPGVMANRERIAMALKGDVSKSGLQYTLGNEAWSFVGHRVTTLNIPQSIIYKGYEFKDRISNATSILSRQTGRQNRLSVKELTEAFESMQAARQLAFKDMSRIIKGTRRLGMSIQDQMDLMKAAKISQRDRIAIMAGVTPRWTMSKQFTSSAQKRAELSAADAQRRNEIASTMRDRKRLINLLNRE